MHKPVVLESDVHEGSECHDIPHHSIEYISFFHVFHRDFFPSLGMGGIHPFLDSYLSVSFQYKIQRIPVGIGIECYHFFRILAKIIRIHASVENVFRERILIRMDIGIVERFPAFRNSQEPDSEGIGFFGKNLLQSFSGFVRTVVVYLLCLSFVYSGYMLEHVNRGVIHADSDLVYHIFHHISEFFVEFLLGYVVLVHPDSDGSDRYFHELG